MTRPESNSIDGIDGEDVSPSSVSTENLNNALHVSEYGSDAQAFIDAVSDAEPGTAVVLNQLDGGSAYTWDQQVSVSKRITIVQRGDVTLANSTLGTAGDTALTISAAGATYLRLSGEWGGNKANNTGELLQANAAGVDIINARVVDAPGPAVDLVNSENCKALGCTVIDPGTHGIRVFGADSAVVDGCTVRNPANDSNEFMVYLTNSPQDVVVADTTIRGGTNTQQGFTGDTTPVDCSVTGLTVTGDFTQRSINWEGFEDSRLEVVISNNTANEGLLMSGSVDCDIQISATDISRWGVRAINDMGSTIRVGTIARCGDSGTDSNACGVLLEGADETTVTGGRIVDNDSRGVRIEDSGSNSTPTNNRVTNIRALDDGSTDQDTGVETTSGPDGTVVINNDLRGNATQALNLNGSNEITDPVNQNQTDNYNIT